MKIAVAQLDCIPGDIEKNCGQMNRQAHTAKDEGCELIVFPELIDTGYEINSILSGASAWPGYPYLTAQSVASESGINLACGLTEKEGDKIFNSLAIFDLNGNLVGKYRKIHLMPLAPVCEDRHLSSGKLPGIVQMGDITLGLLICYDLRFPDLSRELVRCGAQVLVVCSAWPFPRQNHWEILTAARAIESQCYVVASNRIGTDGNLAFCGTSRIVDPDGTVIASASQNQEELLVAEIDVERVRLIRQNYPFLEDEKGSVE